MSETTEHLLNEPEAPEPDAPIANAHEPQSQPAATPQPEAPRTVPLAVLMEERRRRQEMEQELQRLRQASDQSTGELRRLVETLQPKAPPPPDINTDPLAYIQHQDAERAKELAELRQWRQQQEQERQRAAAHQQVMQRFQSDASAFSTEAPDFNEAYQWVSNKVIEDFRATGLPDQVAAMRGQQLALDIVEHAARTGGNAAAGFYKLAQQRGWKGPEKAAPAAASGPDVETLQKVAQASRSISGPGATPKSYEGLTRDQLASMTQSEYNRVPDSIRQRLLRA